MYICIYVMMYDVVNKKYYFFYSYCITSYIIVMVAILQLLICIYILDSLQLIYNIFQLYPKQPNILTQQKPLQNMQSIIPKYQLLITTLYQKAQTDQSYGLKKQSIQKIFQQIGRKQITKINNKLNIVMDNDFAVALMKKIKNVQKKYSNDFQKLKSNIYYLTILLQCVGEIEFITIRERRKISNYIQKITGNLEYRINLRMKFLQKATDVIDLRDQLFHILGYDDADTEDEQLAKQIYHKFYQQSLKNLDRHLFIKLDSLISTFQNRSQFLGKQLQHKINTHFGKQIGKNDQQIQINRKLIQRAQQQSLSSNQQNVSRLQQHYEEIKRILNKFCSMKIFVQQKISLHLAKFGSIVSGFATKNTDMDLTILTNCYINQQQLLKYLEQFLKAQFKKQNKNFKGIVKFVNARIPLLKINLTSNKGQSSIDLIINNILGVINSKFLSVYASVPWIRYLGILIKLWAKNKQLIGQNTFSSYSFNLFLLHFLLVTNKINLIMDARQRNVDKTPYFNYKRCVKGQQQSFRVYYQFKNQKQVVTSLTRVNLLEILTQFFNYYREDGRHWKNGQQQSIITVDGSKCKQFQKDYIFTIKDPFDQKHNPGRVQTKQKFTLLKHLENGYEVLKSRNVQDIMNMFKEKEKL